MPAQRHDGATLLSGLLLLLAGSFGNAAASCPENPAGPLHVPSPDWRDQIIYFVMIDRFDDGDPSNNNQQAGEYDPSRSSHFSGGDLIGLCQRIGYIRDLGATAVWITPPVANQWWDSAVGYGGYHGYWAENFRAIDRHFGDLASYQRLSRALHAENMYLIQDIVVNHTGNFFGYDARFSPGNAVAGYQPNSTSQPVSAPTQWPFSLNDPRLPEQLAADIYHWTPQIKDFTVREQELTYALADLDDLNTENPLVRHALRDSYGYWLREAGVDGFRVDTAFYVPPEYFRDFLHSDDPKAPGILTLARKLGKQDFHVFGEGFGIDRAFEDTLSRKIEAYARDDRGQPVLTGMINFPLYGTLGDVFARGRPSAELADRIERMMAVHADPHRMPTFVDNHDVERFLAGGSEAGLQQALLALMTLPGIPVIYYGTEQGFRGQRASMFATGHGSGGRDHFTTDAPLYRYLQQVIALRRGHPVFPRGTPTVLAGNAASAGALAYRMEYGDDTALILFNSADSDTLIDNLDTGLPTGTRLKTLFAMDGQQHPAQVGADGRLSVRLPARAGIVWTVDTTADTTPETSTTHLHIDPLTHTDVTGDFEVTGTATGLSHFQLVVDGDLEQAIKVAVDAQGRWQARVDTAGKIDPGIAHRLVAWAEATHTVSSSQPFRVTPQWTLLASVKDPAADDVGPTGHYQYPNDPTWQSIRPLDIRAVRAFGAKGSLRIEIELHELVAEWNPANGFDHLAVTAFLELPGRNEGATVMPQQNASLPDNMHWHYRARASGWASASFSAEGASADNEGRAVAPSPQLKVDRVRNTLTLTLPASTLGRPDTLNGARLYLTTWDYDGGYRALAEAAGAHRFGGGAPNDPKIMDDTVVITLGQQ